MAISIRRLSTSPAPILRRDDAAEENREPEAWAEVLKRYLELGLDGWRVDVANMTGRYRDVDLNREVSRWMRAQVGAGLLIAEHGHDFRPDLASRGWHGVMNYSGFMRPAWTWLAFPREVAHPPADHAQQPDDGEAAARRGNRHRPAQT